MRLFFCQTAIFKVKKEPSSSTETTVIKLDKIKSSFFTLETEADKTIKVLRYGTSCLVAVLELLCQVFVMSYLLYMDLLHVAEIDGLAARHGGGVVIFHQLV